ncbi:hypothetical protein GOODEAATRI_008905 [Goodea atripinnis]|uniref:Uncharacterized protein n=1 Tax=Goodea atripinnis TaxID=208336 RepID=A0ABV0N040_9TELE
MYNEVNGDSILFGSASCLGVEHLWEALSEDACPNCCIMPQAVRVAQLAELEQPTDWTAVAQHSPLPLGQAACRQQPAALSASGKRARRRELLGLVNQLTTEQMKALLQSVQADDGCRASPPEQCGASTWEDDAILVAAPVTFFVRVFPELSSWASG